MKKIKFTVLIILFTLFSDSVLFGHAKKTAAHILSQEEVDRVITRSVKEQFNINYHIYKVYKYSDKLGDSYLVLTESSDRISPQGDTISHKIRALNFRKTNVGLTKQWEINDFTIKQVNGNGEEESIWFWTKYAEFSDIDGDGLVDPLIVYGSSGTNGYDDGRVKILIFYKAQKIAIRHQNGVLDFERNTQVDEAFYSLPVVFQNNVQRIMRKITDGGHAIFPEGWEGAMKKHLLKFDEK